MNHDPRTLAREEDEQIEQDASYTKLLARTCAVLNECYQNDGRKEYQKAFETAWNNAMLLVTSVEFYGMIEDASKELGYK